MGAGERIFEQGLEMNKLSLSALSLSILVLSSGAQAATALSTVRVTATVVRTCTVAATTVAFGNYTPGTAPANVNSNIAVTCTKGTPFTVALDKGTTVGGTIAQRLMAGGGATTLQYNLYQTGGVTLFGDGVTGGSTVAVPAASVTGAAFNVPVVGIMLDNANNQAALAGNYTDTVGVTVTY